MWEERLEELMREDAIGGHGREEGALPVEDEVASGAAYAYVRDALSALVEEVRACSADSRLVVPAPPDSAEVEIEDMPSSPGAQPADSFVVSCSTPPETEAIAAYPIADDGSGAKDDPLALAAHAVVRFSATPEPGWEESVCELFSAGRANFAVAVARIPDASDASLCDVPVEPTPSLALVADSVDVSVSIEVVSMDVPCSDMRVMRGKKRAYLYSANVMTDSYARWSFLANEGDDVVTFVECVREESRVYPRPMRATSLENEPFLFSGEHVAELFSQVCSLEACSDIACVEASNGDVYYYSTTHLSPRRAQRLAEYTSVLRFEKP